MEIPEKPTPKKVEVVQNVPKKGEKGNHNSGQESRRERKRNGSNNASGNVSRFG